VRVLDSLGVRGGSSVDAVARSSGMSVGEVLAVLAPLELAGVVARTERGWVRVPGSTAPPQALSGDRGRR
jgi:predicted Rossmann fold nucleotide-binding protein DprA/Smf involved in DNA uptake